ncbi:MAG: DoxX family protein [Candidatus Omnitrophica bacterium]|nr:DoxX family protein [Candidatus Omnitrophota bacterium]
MKSYATLPLRLALGAVFIFHGLQKAFGLFGGPGIKGFSGMLAGLGFPFSEIMAILVAYVELIAGILLVLGVLTRISSLSLLIIMIVALLKVHLAKGFSIMNGGYEYDLVLILICLSLIISGGGKLSLGQKLNKLKNL